MPSRDRNTNFGGSEPSDKRYRDEEWLREQYVNKELTLEEIASKCDVSPKTISKWRDEFGFTARGRGPGGYTDNAKHRDEAWLRQKYINEGMSLWEMAEECEASADTIRRWLDRNGIPTNPPGWPHDGDGFNYDTAEYRRVRERVIDRDGGACVRCGLDRDTHRRSYDEDLHVHHITPISEGGPKYETDNLETLCRNCHQEEHGTAPQN